MAQPTIIRLPEVQHRTGVSRTTIYAWMKAGTFPSSISLGSRSIGFLTNEIDDWIESRVTASRSSCGTA